MGSLEALVMAGSPQRYFWFRIRMIKFGGKAGIVVDYLYCRRKGDASSGRLERTSEAAGGRASASPLAGLPKERSWEITSLACGRPG